MTNNLTVGAYLRNLTGTTCLNTECAMRALENIGLTFSHAWPLAERPFTCYTPLNNNTKFLIDTMLVFHETEWPEIEDMCKNDPHYDEKSPYGTLKHAWQLTADYRKNGLFDRVLKKVVKANGISSVSELERIPCPTSIVKSTTLKDIALYVPPYYIEELRIKKHLEWLKNNQTLTELIDSNETLKATEDPHVKSSYFRDWLYLEIAFDDLYTPTEDYISLMVDETLYDYQSLKTKFENIIEQLKDTTDPEDAAMLDKHADEIFQMIVQFNIIAEQTVSEPKITTAQIKNLLNLVK